MRQRQTTILASAMVLAALCGPGRALERTVSFDLPDAYGRRVSSQDYVGVPIFLEFGACW